MHYCLILGLKTSNTHLLFFMQTECTMGTVSGLRLKEEIETLKQVIKEQYL